ncbi:hypothetical protein VL20_316 [Microcystis panniformis FACHB-1757]|uniref:Uncharacterized protein n=1 Tax=Microcystis panniformis FACHB-1757 TaxID=1638788 RepID=A0A0K1RUQ3_9CHRO|nr:hypothetical protein VL20_316 [Microcystis panniformis FACHB-1757]
MTWRAFYINLQTVSNFRHYTCLPGAIKNVGSSGIVMQIINLK